MPLRPRKKKRRSSFGDRFLGNLELQIIGRRTGGVLEFFLSSEATGWEVISPKPWQALVILAEHAQKTPSELAFVSAADLALQLESQGVLDQTIPQDAIKLVYRLRRQLNQLPIAQQLVAAGLLSHPSDFGKSLIQRQKNLGYRLALPPSHFTIDLMDDGGTAPPAPSKQTGRRRRRRRPGRGGGRAARQRLVARNKLTILGT